MADEIECPVCGDAMELNHDNMLECTDCGYLMTPEFEVDSVFQDDDF